MYAKCIMVVIISRAYLKPCASCGRIQTHRDKKRSGPHPVHQLAHRVAIRLHAAGDVGSRTCPAVGEVGRSVLLGGRRRERLAAGSGSERGEGGRRGKHIWFGREACIVASEKADTYHRERKAKR